MKKNDKLLMEGFKCFSRNRKIGSMGGIATCVNDKHADHVLKVAEGKDDEYLVTRHGQFNPAMNVINLYGTQESRDSKEKIVERWERILEEIMKIEAKQEETLLIGDLNRHCGATVKNNHVKTTIAGKLLNDWIKNSDYVIVNSLDCVIGGPFTHYSPNDPNNDAKKSLLDYVIVSPGLVRYIKKLEIDNKLNWTPG